MTPETIHLFWGGPPMPAYLADHLQAQRDLHPGWDVLLWTPETLPPLRHQRFYDNPEKYSPKSNVWQYRANLVRYELLHDRGGFWVDLDMEPRVPLDHLRSGLLVAAWERQDVWINNALIGAPPGHPALAEILDGIPASIRSQPKKRSTWQTGVRYITPILRDRDDVHLLDQAQVYPYGWDEPHRADDPHDGALMVHRWHHRHGGGNGRTPKNHRGVRA